MPVNLYARHRSRRKGRVSRNMRTVAVVFIPGSGQFVIATLVGEILRGSNPFAPTLIFILLKCLNSRIRPSAGLYNLSMSGSPEQLDKIHSYTVLCNADIWFCPFALRPVLSRFYCISIAKEGRASLLCYLTASMCNFCFVFLSGHNGG